MRIGIHEDRNKEWSNFWISHCKQNGIKYKIVNAYKNDIIEQLNECEVFLWYFHLGDSKDFLFAKELIYSLELSGKKVFPNFMTCWHYDDKLGQKYLLESLGLPFVPTNIFFTKQSAKEWIQKTDYPFVFKLRGGAASTNVKLVRDSNEAKKLVNKAFGKGFQQYDSYSRFKEQLRKYRLKTATLRELIRPLFYSLKKYPNEYCKFKGNEKGYFYAQKFIPNNNSDTRIVVIGNRAFGIKRMTRKGDFRASGSGHINHNKNNIDIRCLELAFAANKKIRSQSIAFDFIFDENNNPLIVEISYGFANAYKKCEGYWDSSLNWYESKFNPMVWMLEDLVNK